MVQRINLLWQYEAAAERDWIRFLLDQFSIVETTNDRYRTVMEDSIVVMSSRRGIPRSYIEQAARTKKCILYHISDESFHGRYGDYLACDFVFRNCWSSIFAVDRIAVLPLGYNSGLHFQQAGRPASARKHIWCFVGKLKASRPEMLKALAGAYPGFVHVGGSRPDVDWASYQRILEDSAICPCPMGNVNLETPRFYDALEAGCIPIVETRPIMRYYETLFAGFPVPKVRSWQEAPGLIGGLLADPAILDAKQREIADWWRTQKLQLRAEVTRIIEEIFFSGRESCKLSRAIKPIGRFPGWRQLELLRHHSARAAFRGVRFEFGSRMFRDADNRRSTHDPGAK